MDPTYTVRLWAGAIKADDMATARTAAADYDRWLRQGGFAAETSGSGTVVRLATDQLVAFVTYPNGVERKMGPTGLLLATGATV